MHKRGACVDSMEFRGASGPSAGASSAACFVSTFSNGTKGYTCHFCLLLTRTALLYTLRACNFASKLLGGYGAGRIQRSACASIWQCFQLNSDTSTLFASFILWILIKRWLYAGRACVRGCCGAASVGGARVPASEPPVSSFSRL